MAFQQKDQGKMTAGDAYHMKRALHLAARARGRTSPNPMVGALVVRDGRMLAEGYHKRAGLPHAEALALGAIEGTDLGGAVLYVTLEPCCHTDKRTPPCTRAIIASGIKRAVVAMRDPNPKVAGKGIGELREAGIEVTVGVLEEDARRLNEAYIKYITTRRPLVTLKIAMTLDGKTATPEGESKWITGPESRKLVHRMRSESDAVITAIGTVRADDPELTARIRGGKHPVRVVIDPNCETPEGARVLIAPPETIIVARAACGRAAGLESRGIRVLRYDGRLHMDWLMAELGKMGMTSVMLEGGARLNSHALEDGVVDKVAVFVAPKMIGGRDSHPAVGGDAFRKLADAYRIEDMTVLRVGGDILIEGRVSDPKPSGK